MTTEFVPQRYKKGEAQPNNDAAVEKDQTQPTNTAAVEKNQTQPSNNAVVDKQKKQPQSTAAVAAPVTATQTPEEGADEQVQPKPPAKRNTASKSSSSTSKSSGDTAKKKAVTVTKKVFTVQQASIAPMVSRVAQGVNSKKSKKVIENCLLMTITKGGTMNLVGAAADIEIISRTKVNVVTGITKTLKLAVQADRLNNLLRSFNSSDELEFTVKKNPKAGDGGYHMTLILKCGRSQYSLALFDPDAYPSISMSKDVTTFQIANNDLLWGLQRTLITAAHQDVRYYLNGVYMEFSPEKDNDSHLRLVGTDGHRLGTCTVAASYSDEKRPVTSCILPRTSAVKINGLIGTDGDCQVQVSSSLLRVATPFVVITSRLIDGRYPDWRRVCPQPEQVEGYEKCSIVRSDAKQLISRCSLMVNEKTTALSVKSTKDKHLEVSASNATDENGVELISYSSDNEIDLEIGLNATYVQDALNQFDGYSDTIEFFLHKSGQSPLVIKHDDNPTLSYVVMPLRV
ncbi:DNA polymerase III subunit beta [Photobacterium sp. GB-72]|uniref:DNA polymerase III subunit beta n=1 Tax=Photobacterium sp. GB-72 TaxID=2022105 RepID=UPI001304910A|nr:DNA polymerase III subunit beta [Photobacterium sp. GB-72]